MADELPKKRGRPRKSPDADTEKPKKKSAKTSTGTKPKRVMPVSPGRTKIGVVWGDEDKARHKKNFARIRKEINMDQVIYWMDLQATAGEIAGCFHVSTETLKRRIKEEFGLSFTQLRDEVTNSGGRSKCSLRRYQFDLAKKSSAMAIWLGKQWLGQKDHEDKKDELPPHLAKLIEYCCKDMEAPRPAEVNISPADESGIPAPADIDLMHPESDERGA